MGEMVQFIIENFWIMLMILALLCMKGHRANALILLGAQIVWGGVAWLTITVVVISVIVEFMRWYFNHEARFSDDKNKDKGANKRPPNPAPRGPRLVGEERRDPDYV